MKLHRLLLPLALMAALAVPAEAHFRLEEPPDILVVNTTGDPTGGDQKTPPCGVGTKPSNKVTKVAPGGKLHIKLKETVKHGGHYRIALAANRSDFKEPVPVVSGGNCVSAPIQNPPVAPVLADGLFQHGQLDTIPAFWETDITVPNAPCENCTLQIIEFMTPHAPQCFYHHCSTLQITSDAPSDGGVIVEEQDAATTDQEPTEAGATKSSSSGRQPLAADDSSSCAMGRGTGTGLAGAGLLGLVLVAVRRRRRR